MWIRTGVNTWHGYLQVKTCFNTTSEILLLSFEIGKWTSWDFTKKQLNITWYLFTLTECQNWVSGCPCSCIFYCKFNVSLPLSHTQHLYGGCISLEVFVKDFAFQGNVLLDTNCHFVVRHYYLTCLNVFWSSALFQLV